MDRVLGTPLILRNVVSMLFDLYTVGTRDVGKRYPAGQWACPDSCDRKQDNTA